MKIAIIGLGLIGGSLGLLINRKVPKCTVTGFSLHAETIESAKKMGCIDVSANSIAGAVINADIVFVCVPISTIVSTVQSVLAFNNCTIVTDVGSTKELITKQIERFDINRNFIGSHPMAGKETRGIENADASVFKNAVWVITSTPTTNLQKIKVLKSFLKKLGFHIVVINPKMHDKAVASISHSPAFISTALFNSVFSEKSWKEKSVLASSGFRDTTRLASTNPDLSLSFAKSNSINVIHSLEHVEKEIKKIKTIIRKQQFEKLETLLKQTKTNRDGWIKKGGELYGRKFTRTAK
jgi:prephenate dehydrogenase